MKLFILFLLMLIGNQMLKAQLPSKFEFNFGYGFYEGYNIGSEYYFKTGKRSVSLSVGYDGFFNKTHESYSLALGYNFAILQNRKNNLDQFKWRISYLIDR